MKNKYLLIRKISVAIISFCLLLFSTTAVAQHNKADVSPVSGTKKEIKKGFPGVDKGEKNKEDEIGAYTTRRRKLPPGQAKKVYGGSAKDYAPGQRNKRDNKAGKYKHHKKHQGHDRKKSMEKKNHHD